MKKILLIVWMMCISYADMTVYQALGEEYVNEKMEVLTTEGKTEKEAQDLIRTEAREKVAPLKKELGDTLYNVFVAEKYTAADMQWYLNMQRDKNLTKIKKYTENSKTHEVSYDIFLEGYKYIKKENYKEAFSLYKKGCDNGDGGACHGLSFLYGKGLGTKKDVDMGHSLGIKACNLNFGVSCTFVAHRTNDIKEANTYYKKACSLDDGEGCFILGKNHKVGKGFIKDIFKANDYYKKACDLDEGYGCIHLAINYDNGEGFKKDIVKANDFFKKACDLGHSDGCFYLGQNYNKGKGLKQNIFKANSYYKKACDLDDGRGCNNLGSSYNNGEGVRKDQRKAKKLFGRACDLKSEVGCKNYALMLDAGV